MRLVTYNIIVDAGGNATVRREPSFDLLHVKDEDKVQFKSNDPKTVIRYRDTSPFDEAEVGPNTIFDVGNGNIKGPFQVKKKDPAPRKHHHFDCGFRNPAAGGKFAAWGGTQGDDTPVDP